MPPFFELSVASFVQSSSLNTKWAFAIIFSASSLHSLIYQITGSSPKHDLDVPQSVTLKEGENGYIGKIPIGLVDAEKLHELHRTIAAIPINCKDPAWNSHDWVIDGVQAFRGEGYWHVNRNVSPQWIAEQLGEQ